MCNEPWTVVEVGNIEKRIETEWKNKFQGGPGMDKYIRHLEICTELNKTYEAKNKTYGDAFGKTFKELGPISAVTRMTDKMNRITSLVKGQENLVADESLKDTLKDLANYCIMTVIEIEEASHEGL